MANFTTEALVRERFQLNDTGLVPTGAVDASITEAHTELLRFVDPQYDVSPAAAALVQGETLLAGARLLQRLASDEAFRQKKLRVGAQQIDDSARYATLMQLAAAAEEQAWYLAEPYLLPYNGRAVASTTDATPVLGEE